MSKAMVIDYSQMSKSMADVRDAVLRQLDTTIYIVQVSNEPLGERVEFVSTGAFRQLGYQAEEFQQNPGLWRHIMHPDDVPEVIDGNQEMLRLREPRTRTYRLRHRVTGEYHWIADSAVPISDELGNFIGIAGVARDMARFKQTEYELRQRERQLENLIDALPDGVMMVDNSGHILRANAGVERILGWKSDELIGRTVEALIAEPLRSGHMMLRSQYAAAPRIRRMGTYELEALHKNGHKVPVDIMLGPVPAGPVDYVLVLLRDMTEFRMARQKLALLSAIVKSTDESIIGTDLEGVIASWNRGAERLFGYTEAEAIGKHLALVFPQELQQECFDNLKQIGQRERPPRYESRRVRKDGSSFDVSVIISPIEDDHGTLLGMSSICRDITERKRTDAALQVAKRTADMASQAKSEFLANMSHELRTPLSGVIGLTDVVLDSELTEEQRQHLMLVKESAHSLLTILSDILDLASIQAGKYVLQPKQFWVREVVETTMKEFERAAVDKNLRLTWEIRPGVPTILLGDFGCLCQILSNLVQNAIKFTAAGEVAVTVEAPPQDPGVLSFCVRDTGIGIPADRQRIIFEPFSQMDNSLRREFGGTGLGLAICAQLVDIMRGRIWVDSDGHSGSSFHFTVRLAPVDVAPEISGTDPAVPIPAQRRREIRVAARDTAQLKMLRPFAPLPFEIEILDVSTTGMRVRVDQTLDPGTLVQIRFKDTVEVAEVRYCVPAANRFHAGLETVWMCPSGKGA